MPMTACPLVTIRLVREDAPPFDVSGRVTDSRSRAHPRKLETSGEKEKVANVRGNGVSQALLELRQLMLRYCRQESKLHRRTIFPCELFGESCFDGLHRRSFLFPIHCESSNVDLPHFELDMIRRDGW